MIPTAASMRKKLGYGIGAAARALDVPIPTLRDWMNQGKVPGVRKTPGGHRWIGKEDLLRFAEGRGLRRPSIESRRDSRVPMHKVYVTLEVTLPDGTPVGRGTGDLTNACIRGFRVERLRWKGPLAPTGGSPFVFRIEEGRLKGVKGTARVAWHVDGGKSRKATLGAWIESFSWGRKAYAVAVAQAHI